MAKELKLYLPIVLRDIAEYEALSNAETPFLEDLESKTESLVENSFLTTMSETRLAEWENALGIAPSNSSISQRRSILLARFRGTGKLSKTLIQAMVNAFTGGSAEVTFDNGTIYVKVAPPSSTFSDFSIETLTEELATRKPAHLLLNVELSYIVWGQVKTAFSSWDELKNTLDTWDELRLFYTNQEAYSLWR